MTGDISRPSYLEGHLPGCTAPTLAEAFPDESKPDDMSDASWYEVRIARCERGCPILQRSLDRGRELAKEHGW